jgi:thymidylate synthase ThyX|tara:strand:- start:714 stop:917 length:204 start_codon:yes stop_codon:yes gene_type:complete
MKVSKESMEKLGFKRFDSNYWQHERIADLCFSELPSWDKIVFNAFQNGNKCGREQTQQEIKEALGIY